MGRTVSDERATSMAATTGRLMLGVLGGIAATLLTAGAIASCGEADDTETPRDLPAVGSDAGDAGPSSDASSSDAQADAGADADAAPQGTVISASAGSQYEGETQLAVAPNGTIGVAWIASYTPDSYARVAYRFSMDGGGSWTPIRYVPNDVGVYSGDPSIVAADNGDFYIGWLPLDLAGSQIGASYVFVGRVPAGSDEIASFTEATDPMSVNKFRDHPKMLITPGGKIVITYLEAPSFDQYQGPGVAASSADQGKTWQHSVAADIAADEFVNLLFPCKPLDGGSRIYLTYFRATTTTSNVAVRYSDDDGATWSAPVDLNSGPIFAGGDDPTCVAKGNDVWVAYGASNLGIEDEYASQPQQKIRVAHSGDMGVTFPDHFEATDAAAGKQFLHPTIALGDDGSMHVVFYGGQEGGDVAAGLWRRTWTGTTFGPSENLASPLTFDLLRTTPTWLGDYIGLTGSSTGLHLVYTDNRTGASHVAYQRIDLR